MQLRPRSEAFWSEIESSEAVSNAVGGSEATFSDAIKESQAIFECNWEI